MKPGLWGFSYDLLCAGKKVLVTDEELKIVIKDLELKLYNLQTLDANACKASAYRLAEYYNKRKLSDEVNRVLSVLSNSYFQQRKKMTALQISAYIEELHLIYSKYNLKQDADKFLIELRKIQKNTADELKTISTSVEIPKEQITEFVNRILKGDEEAQFIRILLTFTPSITDSKKDLELIASKYPIKYLIKTEVIDYKGRKITEVGPIDEDKEGHVSMHYTQQLTSSGIWLHFTLEEPIKRGNLTVETMMSFLKKSCIIEESRYSVIEQGISEFIHGNYVVSIHLLIPQFEEAIRNLVEINGGNIFIQKWWISFENI